MIVVTWESLTSEEKRLVKAAQQVRLNAYNPYSYFYVGAAILTAEGEIVTGVNIAPSSSTVNLCAERVAVGSAITAGKRKILALATSGVSSTQGLSNIETPCGGCRQFLLEVTKISKQDLVILCTNSDKSKILKTSLFELLPHPYSRS